MPRRPPTGSADDGSYAAGGYGDATPQGGGWYPDAHPSSYGAQHPATQRPARQRPAAAEQPAGTQTAPHNRVQSHGDTTQFTMVRPYDLPAPYTGATAAQPAIAPAAPVNPAGYDAGRYGNGRYEAPRPAPGHDGSRYDTARHDAARHGAARHEAGRHEAARRDAASREGEAREYGAPRPAGLGAARSRARDAARDVLASATDTRRRRGRGGGPSRRKVTIAAVTTGTIAVSTAAFAGGGGASGTTDASLIGGTTDQSAPSVLGIAQQVADTQPAGTMLSITADNTQVAPNKPVLLTVRALDANAGPLAGEPVRVVVANGDSWRTTAVLNTDADGRAQITAHLLTTTKVSVIFDGTGALRPASASATTVNVVVPRAATDNGLSMADVGLTNAPGSTIGSKAVYLASLQKGKPYVWGATGPYSFDCSGLVQYVYRQLGRSLPRTAESQYEATTRIAPSAKQPGDLIFFGSPGNIYHVAIYAGNGYIWQAPQTGETVQLVPIWSSSYSVGRVM